MGKDKAVRNSLIIASAILALAAVYLTINYNRTKKNTEDFNAVLGKDEVSGFSEVMKTLMNDNKIGMPEENIRYLALTPKNDVIQIREKMFAAQISEVYLNADDYLGKTIKLEGIFKSEQYYEGIEPYCFVVRYGPGGCYGLDANVGFEVKWDESKALPYPAEESWVEATGRFTLDEKEYYLYLDLVSLTVLDRRGGAETVYQ